jgi:peptidoglycan/LPS O-acetylase OafA/YrhL
MIFYGACFLFGYLLQRITKSKWVYLLAPVGAFLASVVSIIALYLIASMSGLEVDGKAAGLRMFLQSFWGTLLVALVLWYYRRKKAQEELDKVVARDPDLPR